MPRFADRLSPALVNQAKAAAKNSNTKSERPAGIKPGMYADGGGLYLHINARGAASWIFRYMRNGRAREMGLGSLLTIGLSEARDRALSRRRDLLDGIDPLQVREQQRHQATLDAARAMIFEECARRYIKAHKAAWRSPKSLAAWEGTLEAEVYPVFGKVAVQAVDTGLVTKALEPIWTTKPETASRVRGRIEAILDYATVQKWREGENPARWKGHLDKVLPQKAKVRRVQHHPALPFAEASYFMDAIRSEGGMAARALEFAILTAARTGEVIGAKWVEIDRAARLWTIAGDRMKGGREHRVPLSDAALAVLDALDQDSRRSEFVFAGGRGARPLSNMAMLVLLRRMQRTDLTVHGFRSTFRDWAAERTSFQNEVIEMALAHAIGDKVEAAYRRGDLFDKRRRLMQAWADHCQSAPVTGAGVVPIRRNA